MCKGGGHIVGREVCTRGGGHLVGREMCVQGGGAHCREGGVCAWGGRKVCVQGGGGTL